MTGRTRSPLMVMCLLILPSLVICTCALSSLLLAVHVAVDPGPAVDGRTVMAVLLGIAALVALHRYQGAVR